MCGSRNRITEICPLEAIGMEANKNRAEISDSMVAAFDDIGYSQDELAWKLSRSCTTKDAEEENSFPMYCCKTHYVGRSEHPYTGSTNLVNVCSANQFVTIESSDMSSHAHQDGEGVILGCKTPRESIFDAFAPGPEALVCAPKKKMLKEIKVPLRRQLNFDLFDDSSNTLKACEMDDAAEEERLCTFIFESFFDLIVSSQLKELSAKVLPMQDHDHESPKTPISLSLLNGVSETCPPAPGRLPAKSKPCVPGICRKLDFGET